MIEQHMAALCNVEAQFYGPRPSSVVALGLFGRSLRRRATYHSGKLPQQGASQALILYLGTTLILKG